MSTATDASTSGTPGGSAGALTVRENALAPLQVPLPPAGFPGGDSLEGAIDYSRIWHAFRRRWPAAVTLGLLLATGAAAASWIFFPRSYEAAVWLRVRDKSGMLSGGIRDNAEYEAYRKTQLQLVKSPFVLTSALRRPGIADLPTVRDQIDPIDWLAKSIQITAPMDSEVVQVRMRGRKAADVTKLVNAVTASYLDEVVNKERTERLGRRDALEKKYKENMSELRSRRETFNTLARTLGTRDSAEVATQRSLLLDHLGSLRSQMMTTQNNLSAVEAEIAVLEAHSKGSIAADDIVSEQAVEAMLLQDEQLAAMNGRLASIEESILYQSRRSARGLNDPAVKRMRVERDDLVAGIASYTKSVRPRIVAQLAAEAVGGRASASPSMLKMRRDTLARNLAKLSTEFDAVSKEVTELGKANADMEARQGEIEQLQQVTDQIGMQLETSSIDLSMPNRVQIIEEAGVPVSSDRNLRTMLTAMAGLLGLTLGGGGIVLLEYLRDRLNATDEIQARVGIRLLGTLPRISRSRQRAGDGLVIESVDGIRAVIAQSGREAPKVILVTSAAEHEGKTTVASQLAASLARSDRRTLILDGDLRHPNVHLALELELGPGLPELLRGEIGNDEAVKPTSIDGLFAVTGGSCDYAAVTALSRPELAKVINGFRESFDHVVIDAGPVLAFADSLLLGQQADVAIIATMRDVSSLPAVNASVDRLREVGVRILGAVVNGVSGTAPRRMYASPLPG
jgi:capsular exopolysaccharide synthesis family protein